MLGVALGLAPVLAACTASEDVKRLSFLNWTDYIGPNTLADFDAPDRHLRHLRDLHLERRPEEAAEQAGRVRLGGRKPSTFDLVVPSDNFVREFRDDDLIQKLDLDRSRTWRTSARSSATRRSTRATSTRCRGPPGRPGSPTTPTSSASRRATTCSWTTRSGTARRSSTRPATRTRLALFSLGKDPNTTRPADIDAATDQLLDMKKVITGSSPATTGSSSRRGDTVVAQAYSSDFQLARERNPKLCVHVPGGGRAPLGGLIRDSRPTRRA